MTAVVSSSEALPGTAEYLATKLTGHDYACVHFPKINAKHDSIPYRLGLFSASSGDISLLETRKLCIKCFEDVVPNGNYNYWLEADATQLSAYELGKHEEEADAVLSNLKIWFQMLAKARKLSTSTETVSMLPTMHKAGSEGYVPGQGRTPGRLEHNADLVSKLKPEAWKRLRKLGKPFYITALHPDAPSNFVEAKKAAIDALIVIARGRDINANEVTGRTSKVIAMSPLPNDKAITVETPKRKRPKELAAGLPGSRPTLSIVDTDFNHDLLPSPELVHHHVMPDEVQARKARTYSHPSLENIVEDLNTTSTPKKARQTLSAKPLMDPEEVLSRPLRTITRRTTSAESGGLEIDISRAVELSHRSMTAPATVWSSDKKAVSKVVSPPVGKRSHSSMISPTSGSEPAQRSSNSIPDEVSHLKNTLRRPKIEVSEKSSHSELYVSHLARQSHTTRTAASSHNQNAISGTSFVNNPANLTVDADFKKRAEIREGKKRSGSTPAVKTTPNRIPTGGNAYRDDIASHALIPRPRYEKATTTPRLTSTMFTDWSEEEAEPLPPKPTSMQRARVSKPSTTLSSSKVTDPLEIRASKSSPTAQAPKVLRSKSQTAISDLGHTVSRVESSSTRKQALASTSITPQRVSHTIATGSRPAKTVSSSKRVTPAVLPPISRNSTALITAKKRHPVATNEGDSKSDYTGPVVQRSRAPVKASQLTDEWSPGTRVLGQSPESSLRSSPIRVTSRPTKAVIPSNSVASKALQSVNPRPSLKDATRVDSKLLPSSKLQIHTAVKTSRSKVKDHLDTSDIEEYRPTASKPHASSINRPHIPTISMPHLPSISMPHIPSIKVPYISTLSKPQRPPKPAKLSSPPVCRTHSTPLDVGHPTKSSASSIMATTGADLRQGLKVSSRLSPRPTATKHSSIDYSVSRPLRKSEASTLSADPIEKLSSTVSGRPSSSQAQSKPLDILSQSPSTTASGKADLAAKGKTMLEHYENVLGDKLHAGGSNATGISGMMSKAKGLAEGVVSKKGLKYAGGAVLAGGLAFGGYEAINSLDDGALSADVTGAMHDIGSWPGDIESDIENSGIGKDVTGWADNAEQEAGTLESDIEHEADHVGSEVEDGLSGARDYVEDEYHDMTGHLEHGVSDVAGEFGNLGNDLEHGKDELEDEFERGGHDIEQEGEDIGQDIEGGMHDLESSAVKGFDSMGSGIEHAWSDVESDVDGATHDIGTHLEDMESDIGSRLADARNYVEDEFSQAGSEFDAAKDDLESDAEDGLHDVQGVLGGVGSEIEDGVDDVASDLDDAEDNLESDAEDAIDDVGGAFGDVESDLEDGVSDIDGFVSRGIGSDLEDMGSDVEDGIHDDERGLGHDLEDAGHVSDADDDEESDHTHEHDEDEHDEEHSQVHMSEEEDRSDRSYEEEEDDEESYDDRHDDKSDGRELDVDSD